MPRVVHRYDPPDRFVAGTVGEPGARTFFLQAREGRRVTSVSLEKEQVAVLAGRVEEILDQAAALAGAAADTVSVESAFDVDSEPLDAPITEDFRVGTLVLAWQPGSVDGGDRLVIQAYAVPPPDAAPEEVTDPGPAVSRLAAELGAELPPELAESLARVLAGEESDDEDSHDEDADDDADELEDDNFDEAEMLEEDSSPLGDPLEATEEDTDALVVRLDTVTARAFARRCAVVVAAGRPACPFCGRPLDPAGHLCPRANGYRPARA